LPSSGGISLSGLNVFWLGERRPIATSRTKAGISIDIITGMSDLKSGYFGQSLMIHRKGAGEDWYQGLGWKLPPYGSVLLEW
jgi:hypothetical protein